MTEEHAHRKFRSVLLKFWDRRGGRQMAIEERGGITNEDTRYLIDKIIDSRQSGPAKEYRITWIAYGGQWDSWEPETAIPKELIRNFNRRQRRRQRLRERPSLGWAVS